jgi:spore germination cell wall hydrolase CwlJ-like protein
VHQAERRVVGPVEVVQHKQHGPIARRAREQLADGGAPRALFFHARYVSPRWKLTRVAAVGNHIFYR